MPLGRTLRIAVVVAVGFGGIACWTALPADEQDGFKVGLQADGRIVVPTNQVLKPAGKQITFPGRPVDLALAEDGLLVIKNMKDLVFLEVETGKIRQTLASPVGFSVIGLLVQGNRVYVTDAKNHLRVAARQENGSYQWVDPIDMILPRAAKVPQPAGASDKVGEAVHPAGVAAMSKAELWVTTTRGNCVQLINLASSQVEQLVQVGVAPYMVCCPRPDRCYVTNWGGDLPGKDEPQGKTSGTPVRVDPRTGVASQGTVSLLQPSPGKWRQTKTIPVGLHPSGMIASTNSSFLYVANANSDTVSVIDTEKDQVVETIGCRPEARLPFGSGTNALALSRDGETLYVANGTNNCIAVVRLGAKSCSTRKDLPVESKLLGLIPTGWYPGAVLVSPDGKKLFVANVKGHGSLSWQKSADKTPRPEAKGRNSHDHLGSVSIIDVPDAAQLAKYTEEVNANNRLAYSLAGLEKPRADVPPVPVPQRHGEPSVIKHVVYIIKENRTYDQVLGDMKEGNGDPKLVMFGENVTPNHHALARQFTLFDNFYCSGVLSADGHQWVNEAYVTDYLEKAFGGFTRSYPYEGADPLAYASTGFLWDNALLRKKTFRNYGEFVRETDGKTADGKTPSWSDNHKDYKEGTRKIKFAAKPTVKALEPYTHTGYPGFVMKTPDIYRARIFMDDLRDFEQKGEWPNLIYLYLPCDHTNGTSPSMPTPAAMVADNDLALGQVVEAITRSKFWPETCIFVVEDDPQNGFDHVDGHRTVALVISPYTKRGFVDRTNYNQTGMVKTIELLLGLPPMNQLDLSATAMRNCFQANADLTPYRSVPNRIALDQLNPPVKALTGKALHWAEASLKLDFSEADLADEDTLNRILWHSTRGYETPYPEEFVNRKE